MVAGVLGGSHGIINLNRASHEGAHGVAPLRGEKELLVEKVSG